LKSYYLYFALDSDQGGFSSIGGEAAVLANLSLKILNDSCVDTGADQYIHLSATAEYRDAQVPDESLQIAPFLGQPSRYIAVVQSIAN
jgi:hypothetical protein